MTYVVRLFVVLFALTSLGSAAAADTSIKAPLLDGTEFDSSKLAADQPILLKFWATWCVACIEEMPEYKALYENHGEQVQFLAVNVAVSDPRERVVETVAAHNLQMPVTYDESGVLWSRFDVFGTPEYVLLNKQGEVLHRSIGHDDKLEPALDAALESSGVDAQKSLKMSRPDTGHHMVRDTDGNTIEIMPTGSETIVAYHFAPWCASYVEESYPELSEKCRAFNEQLIALGKKHSSNVKLIGFVVAYSSNVEGVRSFKSRKNNAHPLVFDTTHAYAALAGTRNFPHVTVIAPSGKIVYSGDTVPSNIDQLSQASLSQ